MLKYAPWKGFLLWLGSIPVVIYFIIYHGLDRYHAALINGICFLIFFFWSISENKIDIEGEENSSDATD